MKRFIIILLLISSICYAAPVKFTEDQLRRLKSAQKTLAEVDRRSAQEIADDLQETPYPQGHLQILEAVAQTYRDMVSEYKVMGQAKKEWLHSMILLNVAYYQFGGSGDATNDSGLNIVIRQKLRQYLPTELMENRKIFYSLE